MTSEDINLICSAVVTVAFLSFLAYVIYITR